ncbi:MAG: hypothetical protein JWP89_5125 [Schlesneria sp.]|nr:hypothetical protein [Schlesneria sp.]
MGCVTLVIACGVASAWGRSLIVRDTITFEFDGSGHYIVCTGGRIEWSTWWYADGHSPLAGMSWISGPEWTQPWMFVVSNSSPPLVASWTVPYWWLVLPCSMLSAYLILGKPRKWA